MCEALRLAAVWLLPLWWHARRGTFPPKDLKENFGNQVLSLVVSLYTLATLATVSCAYTACQQNVSVYVYTCTYTCAMAYQH